MPLLPVDEERVLVVFNKTDLVAIASEEFRAAERVSATTGAGMSELVVRIMSALVPDPPAPGEPVPFTPELCDRWS